MADDLAQADIVDFVRRTHALMYPNGTLAPGVEQLAKLQHEMAGQTETFTRHWFERRQEAAETGIKALRQISEANGTDPAASMRAITDWQRGSLDRVTADLREWAMLCVHAMTAAAIAKPEPQPQPQPQEAADQSANAGKRSTATKGRAGSSGAKAQHATPV